MDGGMPCYLIRADAIHCLLYSCDNAADIAPAA